MKLVLVHPPLLSPAAFSRLAPLLRASGHEVVVPDLREAVTAGPLDTWWQRAADTAAASMPDAEAVVAHSGAGALAPPLLERLPHADALVLIDAVLPPAAGVHATSAPVRAMVTDLAVDGVLPPWTSWWPPGVLETEVPDATDRAALIATAPCLPVDLYDVDVLAPSGWEPTSRSYLRLSASYTAEAEDAAARGWHVEHLEGQHLDVLAKAPPVAVAVLELLPPSLPLR